MPAGTSDGPHTVYAVAAPSGDAAAASIVVDDGAASAVPTLTPTSISGDAATFAYTEAEASRPSTASSTARIRPCDSPVDYAGLAAGSHTFQARATDSVGNTSAITSYGWTVNLSVPTIAIAFPSVAGLYNDSGFNAGCGLALWGDVCGTAEDDTAVTSVRSACAASAQVSTGTGAPSPRFRRRSSPPRAPPTGRIPSTRPHFPRATTPFGPRQPTA